MLKERVGERVVYLIIRGPFRLSLVCAAFYPGPWVGGTWGPRALSVPLPSSGVSGVLAVDKHHNKKLLLNEIIATSTWAL